MTAFFQAPAVFEQLKQVVLPQLFAGKGLNDAIRSWVVGCATGEVAYALAILLLEYSDALDDPPQFQIFATDTDEAALARARAGLYPTSIEADVSPERLARFFIAEANGYRVAKAVRELVVFAAHDLLKDPPFSQLHLLVCRNTLPALEHYVQRWIWQLFSYALRKDGFLCLDEAETLVRADLFRVISQQHGIFQRQAVPVQALSPPFSAVLLPLHEGIELPPPSPPSASAEALHRQMTERYGPPTLLVDAEYTILYLSSTADRYLYQPPGEPTNNLLDRIRPELQALLRTALHTAFNQQSATQVPPTVLEFEGKSRLVSISVRPADEPDLQSYALVSFAEQAVPAELGHNQATTGEPVTIDVLQEELAHTRQALSRTIEESEMTKTEMWATNEELQSMNEELRAVAGELETNKEELQSLNEELLTINQEYKQKVEELSQLTSKLDNLLQATDIATIFLDRALAITWFTPAASAFFHLRQSDIGRPLAHFTHSLVYTHLEPIRITRLPEKQ